MGVSGNYQYFRPYTGTSGMPVYSGSSANPWYKTFTERLEVTGAKPNFPYVVTATTLSAVPNVRIGTDSTSSAYGLLSLTTHTNSSKTIKHDIDELKDENINAERLYDIDIFQFKYNDEVNIDKEDCRYGKTLPGFIIEDLDEKYPIAVDKESDDVKHWSWNSTYLIPPMLKLIQDQHKEIEELKNAVNELKEKSI